MRKVLKGNKVGGYTTDPGTGGMKHLDPGVVSYEPVSDLGNKVGG